MFISWFLSRRSTKLNESTTPTKTHAQRNWSEQWYVSNGWPVPQPDPHFPIEKALLLKTWQTAFLRTKVLNSFEELYCENATCLILSSSCCFVLHCRVHALCFMVWGDFIIITCCLFPVSLPLFQSYLVSTQTSMFILFSSCLSSFGSKANKSKQINNIT